MPSGKSTCLERFGGAEAYPCTFRRCIQLLANVQSRVSTLRIETAGGGRFSPQYGKKHLRSPILLLMVIIGWLTHLAICQGRTLSILQVCSRDFRLHSRILVFQYNKKLRRP